MKFKRFWFMNDWTWIFIIPTITFIKDEVIYCRKNCGITFDWLGWHFKWQWMTEDERVSVKTR